MNTIIFENVDKKSITFFKSIAEMLNTPMHIKKEMKYHPELLKDIEDYETGKVKPIKFDEAALKKLLK
jgi:hypothetical protein